MSNLNDCSLSVHTSIRDRVLNIDAEDDVSLKARTETSQMAFMHLNSDHQCHRAQVKAVALPAVPCRKIGTGIPR